MSSGDTPGSDGGEGLGDDRDDNHCGEVEQEHECNEKGQPKDDRCNGGGDEAPPPGKCGGKGAPSPPSGESIGKQLPLTLIHTPSPVKTGLFKQTPPLLLGKSMGRKLQGKESTGGNKKPRGDAAGSIGSHAQSSDDDSDSCNKTEVGDNAAAKSSHIMGSSGGGDGGGRGGGSDADSHFASDIDVESRVASEEVDDASAAAAAIAEQGEVIDLTSLSD